MCVTRAAGSSSTAATSAQFFASSKLRARPRRRGAVGAERNHVLGEELLAVAVLDVERKIDVAPALVRRVLLEVSAFAPRQVPDVQHRSGKRVPHFLTYAVHHPDERAEPPAHVTGLVGRHHAQVRSALEVRAADESTRGRRAHAPAHWHDLSGAVRVRRMTRRGRVRARCKQEEGG